MSGKGRIGPSTSQKNVNRRPHLLLLSGLQHPCGADTRCLKIGNKDGINTVGRRMINGQTRGDRHHRLVFKSSRSLLQDTEVPRLQKDQSEVVIDKKPKI